VVKRKAGGSTARVDLQFAIHRWDVAIHCIGAQSQLLGELMITQPLTEEAQHLDFPRGQPGRPNLATHCGRAWATGRTSRRGGEEAIAATTRKATAPALLPMPRHMPFPRACDAPLPEYARNWPVPSQASCNTHPLHEYTTLLRRAERSTLPCPAPERALPAIQGPWPAPTCYVDQITWPASS
jgi:hypothetical protein